MYVRVTDGGGGDDDSIGSGIASDGEMRFTGTRRRRSIRYSVGPPTTNVCVPVPLLLRARAPCVRATRRRRAVTVREMMTRRAVRGAVGQGRGRASETAACDVRCVEMNRGRPTGKHARTRLTDGGRRR